MDEVITWCARILSSAALVILGLAVTVVSRAYGNNRVERLAYEELWSRVSDVRYSFEHQVRELDSAHQARLAHVLGRATAELAEHEDALNDRLVAALLARTRQAPTVAEVENSREGAERRALRFVRDRFDELGADSIDALLRFGIERIGQSRRYLMISAFKDYGGRLIGEMFRMAPLAERVDARVMFVVGFVVLMTASLIPYDSVLLIGDTAVLVLLVAVFASFCRTLAPFVREFASQVNKRHDGRGLLMFLTLGGIGLTSVTVLATGWALEVGARAVGLATRIASSIGEPRGHLQDIGVAMFLALISAAIVIKAGVASYRSPGWTAVAMWGRTFFVLPFLIVMSIGALVQTSDRPLPDEAFVATMQLVTWPSWAAGMLLLAADATRRYRGRLLRFRMYRRLAPEITIPLPAGLVATFWIAVYVADTLVLAYMPEGTDWLLIAMLPNTIAMPLLPFVALGHAIRNARSRSRLDRRMAARVRVSHDGRAVDLLSAGSHVDEPRSILLRWLLDRKHLLLK